MLMPCVCRLRVAIIQISPGQELLESYQWSPQEAVDMNRRTPAVVPPATRNRSSGQQWGQGQGNEYHGSRTSDYVCAVVQRRPIPEYENCELVNRGKPQKRATVVVQQNPAGTGGGTEQAAAAQQVTGRCAQGGSDKDRPTQQVCVKSRRL
jgi:hypothetical protein